MGPWTGFRGLCGATGNAEEGGVGVASGGCCEYHEGGLGWGQAVSAGGEGRWEAHCPWERLARMRLKEEKHIWLGTLREGCGREVEDAGRWRMLWMERWRAKGKTGRGRVLVEKGGGCHQVWGGDRIGEARLRCRPRV